MKYLNSITTPKDLKKIPLSELPIVCQDIREYLLNTIGQIGGHLASNLGVVELTTALHYIYNSPQDKFCWDVGHQSYVHKILTGRKNQLNKIRTFNNMSGFPKREESAHDHYNTGHAGTAISQALGEAIARDFKVKSKSIKQPYNIMAIVGDASIASGMSLEALNHAGEVKSPFLVILNDNKMSISNNVGALNYAFHRFITTHLYRYNRNKMIHYFAHIPLFKKLYNRFRHSVRSLFVENLFFEAFGFRYLGPIDGHDVLKLVHILENLKELEVPTILHICTQKGKGYKPAEQDPIKYHGIKSLVKEENTSNNKTATMSYSNFVSYAFLELIKKNKKLYVLTPAMKEGSGLVKFAEQYPDRVLDTGIAEQHATTLSGALGKAGLTPFLCIYSTFLQRGYDQLIQDIALMNLSVKIIIDRAGCVGGDGETHQGLYDIAYLSCVPNLKLLSPSNPIELLNMIFFMNNYNDSPIAVRFPKKDFPKDLVEKWKKSLKLKTNTIPNFFMPALQKKGKDILILVEGGMLDRALEIHTLLVLKNIHAEVVSLPCIYPIHSKHLKKYLTQHKYIFSLENHSKIGGMGQLILSECHNELTHNKVFHIFAFPNEPIPHGSISDIEKDYGLDAHSISSKINYLYQKNK